MNIARKADPRINVENVTVILSKTNIWYRRRRFTCVLYVLRRHDDWSSGFFWARLDF